MNFIYPSSPKLYAISFILYCVLCSSPNHYVESIELQNDDKMIQRLRRSRRKDDNIRTTFKSFPTEYADTSANTATDGQLNPEIEDARILQASPCSINQSFLQLQLQTDYYAEETSWKLINLNTNQIIQAESYIENRQNLQSFDYQFCIPTQTCHEFTIEDDWGDGLFYDDGAFYKLYLDGNLIASSLDDDDNGNFGKKEVTLFGCPLPTERPTSTPSMLVTTTLPSLDPSMIPSVSVTELPSVHSSINPSISSSMIPSMKSSMKPSILSSTSPSISTSTSPSSSLSIPPSISASTSIPTNEVTSMSPSISRSIKPSIPSSMIPSVKSSISPSISPSTLPSRSTSISPSTTTQPPPIELTSISPSISRFTLDKTERPSVNAVPSRSPIKPTTSSPTITFHPSYDPSSIPTNTHTLQPTSCVDDPSFAFKETSDRTCDSIYEVSQENYDKFCSWGFVVSACPMACATCCANDETFTFIDNNDGISTVYKCEYLSSISSTIDYQAFCSDKIIYRRCQKACRTECGNSTPTLAPTISSSLRETTISPYTIQNNKIWKDTDGNTVWASFGGHITLFGDTYYWIGTDPRLDDSSNRIYSSKTLGSSTWKFESYVDERKGYRPGASGLKILGRRNCTLLYCPTTQRYIIMCKGVTIYESTVENSVLGPYEIVNTLKGKTLLGDRGKNGKHKKYKAGGMSAYHEDGKAYIIVSLRNNNTRIRYALILEMTSDFLRIEREVLWLPMERNREAFWLFQKDGKYYMTYDGPGGWMGSDCYYRTANALEGPWSREKEIGMDPEPKEKKMRSHASQQRYIMNINGQWLYGGDRYPYQEPSSHPPKKGLHIMCPVRWDGDRPVVVWEKEWNIRDYSNRSSFESVI